MLQCRSEQEHHRTQQPTLPSFDCGSWSCPRRARRYPRLRARVLCIGIYVSSRKGRAFKEACLLISDRFSINSCFRLAKKRRASTQEYDHVIAQKCSPPCPVSRAVNRLKGHALSPTRTQKRSRRPNVAAACSRSGTVITRCRLSAC